MSAEASAGQERRIVELSGSGFTIGEIAAELNVSRSTVKAARKRQGIVGLPGPKKEPLDWVKCGSEAQYQAHRRRGETPCVACRVGMRIASNERKKRRRKTWDTKEESK